MNKKNTIKTPHATQILQAPITNPEDTSDGPKNSSNRDRTFTRDFEHCQEIEKKYIKNRDWMMAKQWEIKLKDESKKKIHRIT